MEPISAFTATAQRDLENGTLITQKNVAGFTLQIFSTQNSLWVVAQWPNDERIAFRPAFAPNDSLTITNLIEENDSAIITLEGITGNYKVTLDFSAQAKSIFRYTTAFTPAFEMLIPYWPRDIMPLFKNGKVQNTAGTIHTNQVGPRSGQLFFSQINPEAGSVFYFQNLTALNDYCEATETSAGDLVGGSWPEIGFKLPVTEKNKPLPAGKEFILSDAIVQLSTEMPKDDFEITQQFINHLADVYLLLPKPETVYQDWQTILHKGLDGLLNHKGCWAFEDGRSYLNAYVSDYKSPPEVMVQLAVLLPLTDYDRWSGEDHHPVVENIKEGIMNFYDEKLQTIVRWLPNSLKKLDRSEEQKTPGVMDSWYLYHPLMNLSRLALNGDKDAEDLLMRSIDYAIKVARHFDYEWPVFYKMETLEVLKAETKEGEGGEKDVPGLYAHLMVQVWQLTSESRYLNEAKRAAKKLQGLGFKLFYQANNTAFTAGAMLRLYKETNDELYLNLSYVCIAGILNNVQLWDANYGYTKNFTTFFGMYPLSDAPYTAAYEEQEVFAAMHNYLTEAEGLDILPSVRLLLAEFIKYIIHRVVYYFPPMLPKEMISDEVKTGEIDPNLWVALEDLQDGWQKSGQVGQEVYGAGIAFGIVPRQYFKIKEGGFMLFTDYPSANVRIKRDNTVTINIKGDTQLSCKVLIVPIEGQKLPKVIVSIGTGKKAMALVPAKKTGKENYITYNVSGDSHIRVVWE